MSMHNLVAMDKISVELRLLANFIAACQNARISETAAALGQTPSALSTGLRNLEDRLGLHLFVRQGGHLGLLPAAFWLFRHGCQLLSLESYAFRTLPVPRAERNRLIVELDLSLAIGRFSKALIRATQEMMDLHPQTFVEWRFASPREDDEAPLLTPQLEAAFSRSTETARIFYGAPDEADDATLNLGDDPWVAVGTAGSDLDLSRVSEQIVVMKMRPRLIEAISAHVRGGKLEGQLRFVEDEPAQLALRLQDTPHLRFLMPASMLAGRMGLSRLETAQLDPPLISPLCGKIERKVTGQGEIFLKILRRSLAEEERNPAFDPKVTTRQIQYFNLACRSGGISAAARVANLSQSSISAQIQKMETAIGVELLERRGDGTLLSPVGGKLLPFTAAIEERQAWILRKSRDIAAHSQANVRIGTLPSSGHDSALTEKIASVITGLHAQHPTWKLQISEDSNAALHEKIRAGDLNIAIVGAPQAQVSRISLGASEALSVVANPRFKLPVRFGMPLADVCKLPMVLGAKHLSIHQNFVEAARARNIHITPVIEVGSLALAIAIVRTAPLCTILPASSVQRDVEAGRLAAFPIREEDIGGALSIIFSSSRSLSEAERYLVQALITIFKNEPRH